MVSRFLSLTVFTVVALVGLCVADCGTELPTPTIVLNPSCNSNVLSADPNCWSPKQLPVAQDIVLFPAGSTALFPWLGVAYTPFRVRSIIVPSGARVVMNNIAVVVDECFYVNGDLVLNVTDSLTSGSTVPLPPDPSVPENTDCALLPAGFTPRICGPGHMVVSGSVVLAGYYSSLFTKTTILPGGSLLAHDGGFIWGNVTNYGAITTSGYVYIHGFIYNQASGVADFSMLAFDKWAQYFVESPPILLENRGKMTFRREMHGTLSMAADGSVGTYKAALLNYGEVLFIPTPPSGVVLDNNMVVDGDFDLFNFGTVTFKNNYYYGFSGSGNFINRGTFIADAMKVSLSTYHSVGGTLVTTNEGSFSFGSGSIDPATVKLCTMTRHATRPADEEPVEAKPPQVPVRSADGGCWWYGEFCYAAPYLWAPPMVRKRQPKLRLGSNAIDVELRAIVAAVRLPSPCSKRYSFEDSVIEGDGTGSVVSTLPVEVVGTLKVNRGGKVYWLAEHHHTPTFGGGRVAVSRGGELHLGIEADLSAGGSIEVGKGGILSIPRHATVMISNHTIDIAFGATVNLDGKLSIAANAGPVRNCGTLRGVGKLTVADVEKFSCDSAKKNDGKRKR